MGHVFERICPLCQRTYRARSLICPVCAKAKKADYNRQHPRVRPDRDSSATNWQWRRIVKEAIAAEPWCHLCGGLPTDGDPLTGDHIVPVALGGQSIKNNCQPAHRSCNSRKAARYIG